MKKCDENYQIPKELLGDDVYDTLYTFDNEDEAVFYIVENYGVDANNFILELHEDDFLRNEYGKEHYLRSASVMRPDLILSELMNGEYILWEAY